MARPKKNLKEVNIDELGVEEIEELNENQFPDIPMPEEPSVEEQIKMATDELEQRCNDLTQQIYYKEQENMQLRKALQDQADYFDKTTSNLVQAVFGPKGM